MLKYIIEKYYKSYMMNKHLKKYYISLKFLKLLEYQRQQMKRLFFQGKYLLYAKLQIILFAFTSKNNV